MVPEELDIHCREEHTEHEDARHISEHHASFRAQNRRASFGVLDQQGWEASDVGATAAASRVC